MIWLCLTNLAVIVAVFAATLQLRRFINQKEITMSQQQDSINAAVAEITAMTSVAQGAVTALNGSTDRINAAVAAFAAANPTVDVSALNTAVDAEKAAANQLAAAITTNTPTPAATPPAVPATTPTAPSASADVTAANPAVTDSVAEPTKS